MSTHSKGYYGAIPSPFISLRQSVLFLNLPLLPLLACVDFAERRKSKDVLLIGDITGDTKQPDSYADVTF